MGTDRWEGKNRKPTGQRPKGRKPCVQEAWPVGWAELGSGREAWSRRLEEDLQEEGNKGLVEVVGMEVGGGNREAGHR